MSVKPGTLAPLGPVALTPLSCLRPWPENPRTISAARLADLKQSMLEDPGMLWARPLLAVGDGTVFAGNQRLLAAIELAWESIPALRIDMPWEKARLWALRDNNQFGDWDQPALAELLAELARDGVDLALTGFGSVDLDRLLDDMTNPVDPDEAPPVPDTEPESRPGEIYQLGPHRLLCGDATDPEGLARLLEGVCPEVVWTDPPYGVSYVGKTRRKLTIENDGADARAVFTAAIQAADPLLAPAARFYVCVPAGPLGTGFRVAVGEVGWRLHQTLVWVKDRFVLGHGDHQLQHEDILYGWKPGQGRPGRGRHQGTRWQGGNNASSVFFVDRPARSEVHPTMKPVALIAAQLTNSSLRGDAVLDPFAGSGSTLIACEQLGRRCFAVELDRSYCDVIRQRYEEFTRGR